MSDFPIAAHLPLSGPIVEGEPPAGAQPCPRCGGSGHLRSERGTYRTCLHCAARGIVAFSN